MKMKNLATIALFIFSLIAISLILFGLIDTGLFFFLYLGFSLLWSVILVFSIKSYFKEKSDISFALVMTIFIAISLAFFANNVKAYLKENQSLLDNKELNAQIDDMMDTNKYYDNYLVYLEDEINTSLSNIEKLQLKIIQIEDRVTPLQNTLLENPPAENILTINDDFAYHENDEYEEEEDD